MCQRIGRPPISTIGLGRVSVSSVNRVPRPPARITTFIRTYAAEPRLLMRKNTQHEKVNRNAEMPCIITAPIADGSDECGLRYRSQLVKNAHQRS